TTLVSASDDKTIRLWETATLKELRQIQAEQLMVLSVAFAPDGRSFVSGGYDGTLRLWNSQTGEPLWTIPGHHGPVRSLAFAPDGQACVVAGAVLSVRSAITGEELRRLGGKQESFQVVAYSPDGSLIAAGSGYGWITTWEAASGKRLGSFHGGATAA